MSFSQGHVPYDHFSLTTLQQGPYGSLSHNSLITIATKTNYTPCLCAARLIASTRGSGLIYDSFLPVKIMVHRMNFLFGHLGFEREGSSVEPEKNELVVMITEPL